MKLPASLTKTRRRRKSTLSAQPSKKHSNRKGQTDTTDNTPNEPPRIILLNKPFNTLCQFTGDENTSLLKDFIPIQGVYPAGRLDKDSEGLLVLTNCGKIQAALAEPRYKTEKTYWALVEGVPTQAALDQFKKGLSLKDGITRPAHVRLLKPPCFLWERTPPVRFRKNIQDTWLEIKITEGKNRQVRRMTAAIGFPTLRLIRVSVGPFQLAHLLPGEYLEVNPKDYPELLLQAYKKC